MSAPRLRVGNDVVDLELVRARHASPHRTDRFLRRILSEQELDALSGLSKEERTLRTWAAWAAKESAFKIHSKLLGSRPVFRPSAYHAVIALGGPADGVLHSLSVDVAWSSEPASAGDTPSRGGRFAARLDGWAGDRFLHLAGSGGPLPPPPRTGLQLESGVEWLGDAVEPGIPMERGRFSEAEQAAMRNPLSTRVRIVARARIEAHLARIHPDPILEISPRVEIRTDPSAPGRSPPVIWVDGTPSPDLDLSLSHHGRCVAWALLLPRPTPRPPGNLHLVD